MKQLGIIYCRKSTDRIGRQQNSHYTQLMKCKEVAVNNNITIIEEIIESVSAKKS
jgi:DNA invertase Pin-like site-specific DNA recombinase